MSKVDLIDAFRQVPMRTENSASFGYVFGDWIVVELKFGWTDPRGFACAITSALEHARTCNTLADAVVPEQGRAATVHVEVPPPVGVGRLVPFPARCRVPPGSGGGTVVYLLIFMRTPVSW